MVCTTISIHIKWNCYIVILNKMNTCLLANTSNAASLNSSSASILINSSLASFTLSLSLLSTTKIKPVCKVYIILNSFYTMISLIPCRMVLKCNV